MIAILLISAALAALVAMPLLPALHAWWNRLDARPLLIRSAYEYELHLASALFRRRMTMPRKGRPTAQSVVGNRVAPSDWRQGRPLELQGDLTVVGGAEVTACRVSGSIRLLMGSKTAGWIHAGGDLLADESTRLMGDATAAGRLSVGPGSEFERLRGAPVAFGTGTGRSQFPAELFGGCPPGDRTVHRVSRAGLFVPSGAVVRGSVICRGPVFLGDGSSVFGSIKAHGDVTIGRRCLVDGAIFSMGTLRTGGDCLVLGPCIAEEDIELAAGTMVGAAENRSTVSGRRILAEVGVIVHGIVHALELGRVAHPSDRIQAGAARAAGGKGLRLAVAGGVSTHVGPTPFPSRAVNA